MRRTMMVLALLAMGCGGDEDTKEAEGTSIRDVGIGACGAPAGEGQFVTTFTLAPCTGEHTLEVAGRYNLPEGAYPGSSQLRLSTQRDCIPIFDRYVGRSYWSSDYDLRVVYPSPSAWEQGDRGVLCMVVGEDGAPLTERARGSMN